MWKRHNFESTTFFISSINSESSKKEKKNFKLSYEPFEKDQKIHESSPFLSFMEI